MWEGSEGRRGNDVITLSSQKEKEERPTDQG